MEVLNKKFADEYILMTSHLYKGIYFLCNNKNINSNLHNEKHFKFLNKTSQNFTVTNIGRCRTSETLLNSWKI